MEKSLFLLLIIFVPILGAFLLPIIGRFSKILRNLSALAFVLVSFIFSMILMPSILNGEAVSFTRLFELNIQGHILGFNAIFLADGLAIFMAAVSSFISAIILLYSFGYINHYENQDEYYLMVVLFLGAMMGIVFSANLILLYIFWEITAITSWRLIGFFRNRQHVIRADKAFLVTAFGALTMLLGFIMLFVQTGSFDLAIIKSGLQWNTTTNIAVALILIGMLSKSATLPFHTWLPDAGVAPSPVTALLHAAILVKIGVYVFARLFVATITLGALWQTAVPVIAGVSALVSAGAALRENDLKRIIAYSTVSQIGFIFLGLSTGVEIGIAGGLLYILMHGLSKAGLFLCAGIIEQNTKTKDIRQMGGLMSVMPITAVSFLFCAFSVMGVPPFGGFFAKYMVMAGALNSGHIYIAMMFLVGAFMTILYLFRVFDKVFLGESSLQGVKEGSKVMVFSVALLASLSLVGGILIKYSNDAIVTIVKQMLVM